MILTDNTAAQGFTEESVLHPHTLRGPRKRQCCQGSGDGFTIITVCFFVLAVAISLALIIHIYYGSPEVIPHGAVATDEQECSRVGAAILGAGGSAVDVAVAAVVCLMVVHPQNVGPGGSGVMLIHDHKSNTTTVLDFLSAIPASYNPQDPPPGPTEARSVGVPGLLRGLEHAHNKFGKLPWDTLVRPSIIIARRGFNVSTQLSDALRNLNLESSKADTLFGNFVFPKGRKIVEGDFIQRENFAEFLDLLAVRGANTFYGLEFDLLDIKAMQTEGAEVLARDFRAYKVREWPSLQMTLRNHTLHTAPFAGGPQLVAALHQLNSANITATTPTTTLYTDFIQAIRISQTFFPHLESDMDLSGLNLTRLLKEVLGDGVGVGVGVVPLDASLPGLPEQASSPVSVMDTFDQYVATVVGLGTHFGSQYMTRHGILFNNHLANLAATTGLDLPLTRPFTPYTPVVITDTSRVCGARVVLAGTEMGAAVQVVGQLVLRRRELIEAIKQRRVTVRPNSNLVYLDDLWREGGPPLSGDVRNYVEQHLRDTTFSVLRPPYPGVNGITKLQDALTSWSDSRGGGVAHRLEPSVTHQAEGEETQPPPPPSTSSPPPPEEVAPEKPVTLP